jgi:hypothetical protein
VGKIEILDLEGVINLKENGEDGKLGWKQLASMFGGELILPNSVIAGPVTIIGIDKVHEKMMKKSTHWNVKRLSKIMEDVDKYKLEEG